MAKIIIDGKEHEVADGNNLLHACLSLGLDLPYFCWHPSMGSVGACRQCAVVQYQDENDTQGRVVMSCMTPASDGTRISIDTPQAKDFRAGIIELLMTNHPHDCPVCEEGGECHLQDMTEMSGNTFRSYRNTKRTHRNQYLGPFINHEMNRCIACYRCVRYYNDYAGGDDLQAQGAHNHVYFGRHTDGVLESPFSGNLVEVCPTGVFTDKTFSAHYSRKWDLQTAPSVCQQCGVGCNINPGERYGMLKRITNRYHSEINSYFLCDRGRFGYGFVNSDQRIHHPLVRHFHLDTEEETRTYKKTADKPEQVSAINFPPEDAIESLSHILNTKHTIAIGSPRASLESNFALLHAVGQENFYHGVDPTEESLLRKVSHLYQQPDIDIASLKTIEDCDAVLILGEDVTQTAPRMALSLQQSTRQQAKALAEEARIPLWQDAAVRELAQQDRSPLYVLHPTSTALDKVASGCVHRAPADLARLGFAIAHCVDSTQPAVDSLSTEDEQMASAIARSLLNAKQPLLVAGTSLLNESLIEATAAIAHALHQKKTTDSTTHKSHLHLIVPEANSLGFTLLTEHLQANTLQAAIDRIASGEVKQLVILENDLYRRLDTKIVDDRLEQLDTVVVIDQLWTDTAAKADIIIPAASFAETDGTLVNSEGRAQRFFAVYPVDSEKSDVRASWDWINSALNHHWDSFDAITHACATSIDLLTPIIEVAPEADFRQHQLKVPRMSHRYSGRTAINASRNVSEPKQPQDSQTALGFTMEGNSAEAPSTLRSDTWAPGWNSNQSIHKFQDEVGGSLHDGPSGVRLITPSPLKTKLDTTIPAAFEISHDSLQPFPLYHIFGSEELSSLAEPIRERFPTPYVALSIVDAENAGVGKGDGVDVKINDSSFCLAVIILPELETGLIGLPMGLGGLNSSHLPHRVTIKKSDTWQRQPSADDDNVIASDGGSGATNSQVSTSEKTLTKDQPPKGELSSQTEETYCESHQEKNAVQTRDDDNTFDSNLDQNGVTT